MGTPPTPDWAPNDSRRGDRSSALQPTTVVHIWDHLVLDFTTSAGHHVYVSHYAISHSPSLGTGNVALMSIGPAGGELSFLLADDLSIATRQRDRLKAMGYSRSSLEVEPIQARFSREAYSDGHRLRIEGDSVVVLAQWTDLKPAQLLIAPAHSLVSDEDITAVMVEAGRGRLELDGQEFEGVAERDAGWASKVGRPLLASHLALAEVRLRPPH